MPNGAVKKYRIVIAGCGQYTQIVENSLCHNIDIVFYLDNDEKKIGTILNGKQINSPYSISYSEVDYIIIAAYDYCVLKNQLIDLGFPENKIIAFFDVDIDFSKYNEIFDFVKSGQAFAQCHIKRLQIELKKRVSYIYRNSIYENYDYCKKHDVFLPEICSVKMTVDKIVDEKCSVSRYGDGEFEIVIEGGAGAAYQKYDYEMSLRLREILKSRVDGHLVALADDYGCMEDYSESAKEAIREYMSEEKRQMHYRYIDFNKTYYNAYISRPYVIYPLDKIEEAKDRFMNLKRIWNDKDIVFIEGSKTRSGIGNDLFSNAKSIKRIIAPNTDAYDKYNDILNSAIHVDKDSLILIALGPTATVLAYDLAVMGYWAIDIGHLDLEYEWFMRGKGFSYVRNKSNNEVMGDTVTVDEVNPEYFDTIIDRIE